MRILKGTLTCCSPDCKKEVPATLMESAEGVIQVHEHICGDCLGFMIFKYTMEQADAYKQTGKEADNDEERDEDSGNLG